MCRNSRRCSCTRGRSRILPPRRGRCRFMPLPYGFPFANPRGTLSLYLGGRQHEESGTEGKGFGDRAELTDDLFIQSFTFNDSAHGARLFGLKEFGNIYSRIMNVRYPPFPSPPLLTRTNPPFPHSSPPSMSSKSASQPSKAASPPSPPPRANPPNS